MKTPTLLLLLIFIPVLIFGQRYITKTGHIFFYSDAPLEKIEAHNKQVNAALDTQTGDFVFRVLMKSFRFEKALMQEHFNENYVESDKFPTSVFKGKILHDGEIDFEKQGKYPVTVKGELTIHGQSREVEAQGFFEPAEDGSIRARAGFPVTLSDYGISIPGAVSGKIAEEVEITVDVLLKPYNK